VWSGVDAADSVCCPLFDPAGDDLVLIVASGKTVPAYQRLSEISEKNLELFATQLQTNFLPS
jgi:hypothetical protein